MDEEEAPSRNDEYRERIKAYMEKALREAQVHTSWINVNEEYEAAVADFVEALLTPSEANLFLGEFVPFAWRVAWFGALNSLSQALIKLSSPGVPDVYQGNELWDFSLVDPDNRRPVDYGLRRKLLAELEVIEAEDVQTMLNNWKDGRLKLHVTRSALAFRKENPEIFERGEYVPLEVSGEKAEHLVAFARRLDDEIAIAVVPRLYEKLLNESNKLLPDPNIWSGTWIDVSDFTAREYRNVLTGEAVRAREYDGRAVLQAESLLKEFPVAMLRI